MRKHKVNPGGMKVKTYRVLQNAVEVGVNYGYNRAFKHNESPGEGDITEAIYQAVMNEICEAFSFGDDE